MKKNKNQRTLKIPYSCTPEESETIWQYRFQYSSCVRYTYNRILDGVKLGHEEPTMKELTEMQKEMKNIELIKSHLKYSAIYDAQAIVERFNTQSVCFGGKKEARMYTKKIKGLEENSELKEEYKRTRTLPLYSVGGANKKGNRHFRIIDANTILFCPCRETKIELQINPKLNWQKKLYKLKKLADNRRIPITFRLDEKYIYVSYDESHTTKTTYPVVENRVLGLDLNPNYIGWSVCDFVNGELKKIVDSGIYSLKKLNDYEKSLHLPSIDKKRKHCTNKRKHELISISEQIFKKCVHYQCEIFALEDLHFKDGKKKGKNFNRLTRNQWNRTFFMDQLVKRIKTTPTHIQKIQPQYSSILGNIVFRDLNFPDPVLASVEMARRGWEFSCQYVFDRKKKEKVVIFPDFKKVQEPIQHAAEVLLNWKVSVTSWDDFWALWKQSRPNNWRVSLKDCQVASYFLKYKFVETYNFL